MSAKSTSTPNNENNVNQGLLFGSIAAVIWGAWPVVTALGVKADFTAYQLVWLRLVIAGPILLPWAFRGDNSLLAWGKALVLTFLAGGTYSYVTASGFQHTSALHGGVIIPGAVMLMGLITSHVWLNDKFDRNRLVGAATIVTGLVLLTVGSDGGQSSIKGDLYFFFGGIMWGFYTLFLRIWPMNPVVVTARVSFISLVGILAIYPFTDGVDFSEVPTGMLIMQATWQGLLSAVVAIILFNKGVAILGAAKASVINAIVPVISTALAFFVLSEVPSGAEQLGLLAILAGIGIIMFLKPKPSKPAAPAPQKA